MDTNETTLRQPMRLVAAAALVAAITSGAVAGGASALLLNGGGASQGTATQTTAPTTSAVTASTVTVTDLEGAITAAVAEASDSVVTVSVGSGTGSGFIVGSDGLIATSAHVVAGAGTVTVVLSDGHELAATVVGTDALHDVALLHVSSTVPLPALTIAGGNVGVGQTVISIGTALGEFPNTVTVGVVSGLDRSVDVSVGRSRVTLTGLIQTDAALSSGMSGGPLLNLAGEVVGINTAVAGNANGVAFVEPIDVATELIG